MKSKDDLELLREFARNQSQEAFTALVQRHLNLVYCAALRQVRSPQLAEEVAQSVFTDLARTAARRKLDTILTAWLYEVTRRTAINVVRGEARRQLREQIGLEMNAMNANADDWTQIEALLDEAMHSLDDTDRAAVLLRYFENKSLREVGQTLGTTDDTARKRVNRAVELLREFFAKRGVTVGASGLVVIISANSVQAAPANLTAAVMAGAANSAAVGGSTLTLTKGALKIMAWTKAKIIIGVASGVLLVGGATGTLAFKKWEAYQAYRDSWRALGLDSGSVDRAVPQVRILPTNFEPPAHNLAQTASNDRWGGIGVSVGEIVWAAYDWRPARIVFADGAPAERYDFMANLPQGSAAALQKELRKTLGFVGRPESREMDVLLLKVKTPAAPGLEPPNPGGGDDFSNQGRYYCDDRALSYAHPPHLGLTRFLEGVFGKPIIDQTGLTQHFRIDLKWPAPRPRPREMIKQAMLDQLGLELVPGREPVEMLVVEKVR